MMEFMPLTAFSRLNQAMTMRYLVDIAWYIEEKWQDEALRAPAVNMLQTYLRATAWDDRDPVLIAVGRLADKIAPTMSLKHFLGIMIPLERAYTRGVRDDDFLVNEGDRPALTEKCKRPLYVVLDNVRSAFNVGSILRTAECLGVQQLLLCGYTSTPADPKTQKTAMGCDEHVAWQWHQHTAQAVQLLKQQGVAVIAVETIAGCAAHHDFCFPQPCALMFGNERHGLDPTLISMADNVINIPVFGTKNSLNIGAAFAVCGYEVVRQWTLEPSREGPTLR